MLQFVFCPVLAFALSLSLQRAKHISRLFNRLRSLCSKHGGVPQLFFTPKAFREGPERDAAALRSAVDALGQIQ